MIAADPSMLQRLITSRYLLVLAEDQAKLERDASAHAAIHLLHDAIEIFLVACSDYLNADVSQKNDFVQSFDKINAKLAPESSLTHRQKILEINKVRVNSKHAGVTPDLRNIPRYASDTRDFLISSSKRVFRVDFENLSLVSLVVDTKAREYIENAINAFNEEDYAASLAECRKAIYSEFERPYDVRKFEEISSDSINALAWFSSAPYYARNREYIEKNVNDPFDYIVLDHADIDAKLIKQGIGIELFWNVWRLTPEVYFFDERSNWEVKHDLKKTSGEDIRGRASYVIDAVTEIFLKKEAHSRTQRWVRSNAEYVVYPKAGAPLYKRACRSSEIIGTIPEGKKTVAVDFGTISLSGDDYFWHVLDYTPSESSELGTFLRGYLLQEDTFEK